MKKHVVYARIVLSMCPVRFNSSKKLTDDEIEDRARLLIEKKLGKIFNKCYEADIEIVSWDVDGKDHP